MKNLNLYTVTAAVTVPFLAFAFVNTLLSRNTSTAVMLGLDSSESGLQDRTFHAQQQKLCHATLRHLHGGDQVSTFFFADMTQISQETAYTNKMEAAKFCKQVNHMAGTQKTIGKAPGTSFLAALQHGSQRLQHLAGEDQRSHVHKLLILSLQADDPDKRELGHDPKIVDTINAQLRDRLTLLVLTKDNKLIRTLDQINSPHFKVCAIESSQHCLNWAFSTAAHP
jgi:hypothetical protein